MVERGVGFSSLLRRGLTFCPRRGPREHDRDDRNPRGNIRGKIPPREDSESRLAGSELQVAVAGGVGSRGGGTPHRPEKELTSPMSITEKEEGELPSKSISPESMQTSPVFPHPPQEVEDINPTNERFIGLGPISRKWIDAKLPVVQMSSKFADFDVFHSNQKPVMSEDEKTRFARYRKQTSKGSFELAPISAFRVPIESRVQMGEDMWIEYREMQLPMNSGIMFTRPPPSIANQYRMRAQPRIIDARPRPFYVVATMGGGEKLECPKWYCREPTEEVPPLPTLPSDMRLPLDDIAQPLQTLSLTPNATRNCNILYIGDSTIPGLIRPVEELIRAVESYPGAPKYGSHTPVYGRGKGLYEVLNIPPMNTEDNNFIIMKFQNDFMNIFGAQAPSMIKKDEIINRALSELAKEIEAVVSKAQSHMMGATFILIGMNPINSDNVPAWMHEDPCAVEFARKADYFLRTMVSTKCDVHYLSVVEVFQQNEPLLTPNTATWGAHLTELANFFIAKELRRLIFYTYSTRATLNIADIPRFSLWHAQKGILLPEQVQYCSNVLGLVESVAGNA